MTPIQLRLAAAALAALTLTLTMITGTITTHMILLLLVLAGVILGLLIPLRHHQRYRPITRQRCAAHLAGLCLGADIGFAHPNLSPAELVCLLVAGAVSTVLAYLPVRRNRDHQPTDRQ